jgi:hypothetical protein
VVFPQHLAINPGKSSRFPFLVHDEPGEIFPYDPSRRTLRFFRALSVLFGIVSFVIFARILHLLMPESPRAASIILLVAAVWPNNLQVFSVVSNDGLVCLLSLCLILAVLNCIKNDRPCWKQGLVIGTILALGLIAKMTILLTAGALFVVLLLDSILDRDRGRAYLRILPAVSFPLFLIAGPAIVSRIIWYGDPTGEALLKTLTPAWFRPSPRSFVEVLSAMAQILPGSFLADLCWQQLTLPLISLELFLLWFFFNVFMAIRTALFTFCKKPCREETLKRVLVFSSFFFMFLALYHISVNWVGMQFRHVWNLWPMTLLAPYFAVNGAKFIGAVRRERILNIVFSGLMLMFIAINVLILYNYIIAYKPVQSESRTNLDYSTLINYWVQNPQLGVAYLDTPGMTDVIAYRYFAQNHDWNNVLSHARRALQKGAKERESRLMCVRALLSLGRPNEAIEVLRKGGDHSHEARLLEVDLLVDLGHFQDARQQIRQILPEVPTDVRVRLESILKKISTKPQGNLSK